MTDDNVKICWLNGSFYHCNDILSKIKQSIGNFSEYHCNEDTPADDIEIHIINGDIFSENRLVILNAIPHFSGTTDKSNKKWIEILSNIPNECVVVINRVDTSSRQSIFNFVKKNGKVFEPPEYLKRPDALNYVATRFEEYEKQLDTESIALIVDSIGAGQKGINVDRLYSTAKLISTYVGKRIKNIDKESVIKCLSTHSEFVIWDIFNAIDDRDLIKCEKLLNKFCYNSNTVREAVDSIFFMLLWRFRLLLMLKELKSQGLNDNDILKKVRTFVKVNRSGSGYSVKYENEKDSEDKNKPVYSDYVINNSFKGLYGKEPVLNKFSRTELVKAVKIIEECLLKNRIIDNEVEALLAADSFFIFICGSKDFDGIDLSSLRKIADDKQK